MGSLEHHHVEGTSQSLHNKESISLPGKAILVQINLCRAVVNTKQAPSTCEQTIHLLLPSTAEMSNLEKQTHLSVCW